MSGRSIRVEFQGDENVRFVTRALLNLAEEGREEMRQAVNEIAVDAARTLQRSARDPRERLLADSIRVKRNVVPTINIGGSTARFSQRKIGRKVYDNGRTRIIKQKPPVGVALFGVEFGATRKFLRNGGAAFRPRSAKSGRGRGNRGYWIFPTLSKMQPEIARRWYSAADNVLEKWS